MFGLLRYFSITSAAALIAVMAGLLMTFALLYGVLVVIVRHDDGILKKQYPGWSSRPRRRSF